MPYRSLTVRAGVPALALLCLLATPSVSRAQANSDLREISAYTLTMPKYKQLIAAMLNLGKAAQADPAVGGALEGSGNLTVEQATARLGSVPAAKRAITSAGLTPREFTIAQGAMLQAGMSYGIMKQYKLSPDSVSKSTGVSKANLEFFRANEAEIERLGKQTEGMAPRESAATKDEDADSDTEATDSTE
jgi:hypothetical protein